MYIQGDAAPNFFPASINNRIWPDLTDNITLVSISGNNRQQLLSVGRSNALKYTYIRKQAIDRITCCPEVTVRDLNSIVLTQEEYSVIPQGNAIEVETIFDGRAIISVDDVCVQQVFLHGRDRTLISNLKHGMIIRFLIGNDCVRTLSFTLKKREGIAGDLSLLKRLQRARGRTVIPDHSLAVIMRYLDDMPASRRWLMAQLKNRSISENALKLVRTTIRLRDINKQGD